MRHFLTTFVIATLIYASPAFADGMLSAPKESNSSAVMHHDMGIKEFNNGNMKSAEKHFREAIEISPKLAESHFNLAIALHKQNNHGEASTHFGMAKRFGSANKAITGSKLLQGHLH